MDLAFKFQSAICCWNDTVWRYDGPTIIFVSTVREFKIDINEKLVEIGSTPILEETST